MEVVVWRLTSNPGTMCDTTRYLSRPERKERDLDYAEPFYMLFGHVTDWPLDVLFGK